MYIYANIFINGPCHLVATVETTILVPSHPCQAIAARFADQVLEDVRPICKWVAVTLLSGYHFSSYSSGH